MLTGNVELKAFIEVWGSDGWNLSVDFDFVIGEPDYFNYLVSEIIQYTFPKRSGWKITPRYS